MNINTRDPNLHDKNEVVLKRVRKYGFTPVESIEFPGYIFRVRCDQCGHVLSIKSVAWQMRHRFKHENDADVQAATIKAAGG